MRRTGLWLRIFVALLFAVLPPILLLVGTILFTESVLGTTEPQLVAIVVVVGAIVWAAILGVLFARTLTDDIRSFISLAQRGEPVADPELATEYQQLATSLEERNRQISTLARAARDVPIDDEPRQVVRALVSAVQVVMHDATWRCAVLASDSEAILPRGVYLGHEDAARPSPISDLDRWASTSIGEATAVRIKGPWGSFTVVDVSVSDRLRAVLYAPWEGRAAPPPAELAILSLVGQHFGTALEHSILYAKVRSQADELNRMAALQADFLRGVTHDLQTPLTSIGALASELGADASIPESARTDLDTITHQAERLRRMVSQLLVASRLEAGALTPQVEVFAIPPLIQRTWAALRSDRPFELLVAGKPHLAVGDPDRLEQVLWALFDNAVKYSPPGSPIRVDVTPEDSLLSVIVTDHGTGMDPATADRAFDQFFRSDQARSLAPDGSGVGLYAARGLMEAMGGSIRVRSTLGAGSSVVISLPAEPSQASD
jgi:signal transduction histidine kinase